MQISIVSLSCCNPALGSEDQDYLTRIHEALRRAGAQAQVGNVPLRELESMLGLEKAEKVMPLWQKFGGAMLPAMFVDGDLELFGGIPTREKIFEVITRRLGSDQKSESGGKALQTEPQGKDKEA